MKMYFCSLESGRKWLTCPHCHHWFEVDIDDILPVHGRQMVITSFNPYTVEYRGEPCDGSWIVEGQLAEGEVHTGDRTYK